MVSASGSGPNVLDDADRALFNTPTPEQPKMNDARDRDSNGPPRAWPVPPCPSHPGRGNYIVRIKETGCTQPRCCVCHTSLDAARPIGPQGWAL